MTRIQRRMLRRRRRRRRMLLGVGIMLACCAGIFLLKRPMLQTEWIARPTPSPTADAYDRSVVTREVLLPAQTWYTIQTGVFSTREAALEKAGAYTDRGAPGTLVEEGGKWRVFIASYGREEDASLVRQKLGEQQRVETYLYPWTCPELHLRLSGMAGQLDAAEAGLMLLTSAAELLRDTAILLDAAQLTTAEALQEAGELDAQISLWVETAHSRFGRQPPQLVSELLTMADGWVKRYAAIRQGGESATMLSAELKGQGMQLFDEMIHLRSAISGD